MREGAPFVVLILLLFSTLLFAIGQPVRANMVHVREAGVQTGDWISYDYNYSYWCDGPGFVWPYFGLPLFGTPEFLKLNVDSVDDTVVNYTKTTMLSNGTAIVQPEYSDAAFFQPTNASLPFFIAANLSAGDFIFEAHYPMPQINTTLTRSCACSLREVNYFGGPINVTVKGLQIIGETHHYWDRTTGMLVELELDYQYTLVPEGNTTTYYIHLLLRSTNIWCPTLPTDLNRDGFVGIDDIIIAAHHFASHPTHERWNPKADINNDNRVDIKDLIQIVSEFGASTI